MKCQTARTPALQLVIALALAVTAACGGNKAPRQLLTTPTPSISTTPQPFATTSTSLRAALLTVDDLGSGWLQQSVQDAGATVADAYYCGKKVASFKADAIAVFVTPSNQRLFMFEAISRFKDAATAQAALDQVNAAHAGCFDWISTDGVRKTAWHTESFGRANIGDQSFVEKATGQLEGVAGPSTSVSVAVRDNDTVLSISEAAASDFPTYETLDIASKAVSRYASAVH